MPDYSRPAVAFADTPLFRDWLKARGYAWPPEHWRDREAREREFWRELFDADQAGAGRRLNAFK